MGEEAQAAGESRRIPRLRRTVRRRTWTGIAASGVVTVAMVAAVYFQQRAVLIESHLLQQEALLREIEEEIHRSQERQIRVATALGNVVRTSGEGSASRARAWNLLATDSSFGHLALVQRNGAHLLWGIPDHKPWLAREFYSDTPGIAVSDLEIPPPGRDSTWDAVLAVRVKSVQPGSDVELAVTGRSLAKSLEPFLQNRGVSLGLVNQDGIWLPLFDRDSGRREPRMSRQLPSDEFALLQTNPRGILWTRRDSGDPIPRGSLVHARTISVWGNIDWLLVIHVPRREITLPLIAQFGRTGMLLACLGALWFLLAWVLVRRDLRLTRLEEDLAHLRELRRKDEQLLQAEKLATVGVLVSGLAHEIGTPLGVVSMRLQLLRRRTAEDGEDRKTLDIALRQLERVTGLIRQLLDFARSQPGPEQAVDLAWTVGTVQELLQPLAQRRSAALLVDLPAGLPRIAGLPDGVQQIVLNLAMNALQAIPDGGRVRVAAEVVESEVVLRVDDDGPGIPEDRRAAVFDPFYTTKKQGEGSGLGLTVVLGLVRRMGAQLRVDQGEWGGASFEIRFRAWPDPTPPTA
jgi:signal transduction histidine kinase